MSPYDSKKVFGTFEIAVRGTNTGSGEWAGWFKERPAPWNGKITILPDAFKSRAAALAAAKRAALAAGIKPNPSRLPKHLKAAREAGRVRARMQGMMGGPEHRRLTDEHRLLRRVAVKGKGAKRNPDDRVWVDKRAAVKMGQWEGGDVGMALGSNSRAGKGTPLAIAERTLSAFERMLPDAKEGKHGWGPSDVRELSSIIRAIKAGIKSAKTRENPDLAGALTISHEGSAVVIRHVNPSRKKAAAKRRPGASKRNPHVAKGDIVIVRHSSHQMSPTGPVFPGFETREKVLEVSSDPSRAHRNIKLQSTKAPKGVHWVSADQIVKVARRATKANPVKSWRVSFEMGTDTDAATIRRIIDRWGGKLQDGKGPFNAYILYMPATFPNQDDAKQAVRLAHANGIKATLTERVK